VHRAWRACLRWSRAKWRLGLGGDDDDDDDDFQTTAFSLVLWVF